MREPPPRVRPYPPHPRGGYGRARVSGTSILVLGLCNFTREPQLNAALNVTQVQGPRTTSSRCTRRDGARLQAQVRLPRRVRRGPLDLLGGGYKPHHEDIAGTSKASNRCRKDPRAPLSYDVRHSGVGRRGQTRTSTSPTEGAVELVRPCMCRAARLGVMLRRLVVLGSTPTSACVSGTTVVWVGWGTT